MVNDNLQHNDMVVDALRQAIRSGDAGLKDVPGLLKKTLAGKCWQKRFVHQVRKPAEFKQFIDFIEAYPPEGLGATYDILHDLCGKDDEAKDMLDQAVQRKRGNATGNNQHKRGNVDIINISSRPTGTSKEANLRRLRKSAPKLHEKVIAGEISANAAMVKAGFKPKTFTVPVDVKKAAKVLARNFQDDVSKLIEALRELI